MKIFSWMQSKLNAKQESRTENSVAANKHVIQESYKEEFSDWPHGLFAIGTFGNNNVTDELNTRNFQQSEASCQDDLQDITPEEVEEIQKELNLIIDRQEVELNSLVELNINPNNGHQLQRSDIAVLSRGKDIHLDTASNAIGKKSVSFLLKKMFLCSSGFPPTSSLRDPFPELRHEKSRMKKILRTILSKKIYPQSSSLKATSAKKYLENKQFCMTDSDSEDEMPEANDGSKWVKTDSEFIVLEI